HLRICCRTSDFCATYLGGDSRRRPGFHSPASSLRVFSGGCRWLVRGALRLLSSSRPALQPTAVTSRGPRPDPVRFVLQKEPRIPASPDLCLVSPHRLVAFADPSASGRGHRRRHDPRRIL